MEKEFIDEEKENYKTVHNKGQGFLPKQKFEP